MDISKRTSLASAFAAEGDLGVPRREEVLSASLSTSYPIITSSILREDDDDDVLVRSLSRSILGGGGGDQGQILPTTTSSSSSAEDNSDPRPPGLAGRIPFFGLLCSMLSVVCFSLASLIVKILTDLHALEILAIRSVFQTIFYLSTTAYYGLPFLGVAGHRLDIALRALFGTIAAITIYMSYRLIPLADASTIQFSAPVFVFILAYFILGERITPLHIFTGLVALVGVVFVAKPKFLLQAFDPSLLASVNYEGVLLAVVAAVSTAFGMIMLRKLKGVPVHVVILWFSIATSVSAFTALYFIDRIVWPQGGWAEWAWLVGIGLAGIGDQLFMTLAFKYESAGVVSVSRTMTIVLAFIWDTALLGVTVHWTSVLGSALVTTAVICLGLSKSPEVVRAVLRKLGCGRGGRGGGDKPTAEERAKLLG